MIGRLNASTLLVLLAWSSGASAQDLMVGATYNCPGSVNFILESCDAEWCHVQNLNAYAPDGKGAALDYYRTQMPDRMRGCTPSGGHPVAAAPTPATVPAPSTPAKPPEAQAQNRAATPAPAQEAQRSTRLVPNSYYCSSFIGTPPYGHSVTMPGITINAGGAYKHQDGSTGRVIVNNNTLEFQGGSLDGQAATFDSGPGGRGNIHLFNAQRSRTVIDCDGQQ